MCYYHNMTKRLSLWNKELSTTPGGTEAPSPGTPQAIRAKFFAKNPHMIPQEPPEPAEEPEATPPAGGPLEAGSWEARETVEPLPREALTDRRRGKKVRRVPRHKTRRHAVSIAVSEEEERMLRTYAAGLDKSFSEWSRTVLFRAMGRKVPSRRGKPDE